jgi:hypothetical protein
MQQVRAANFLLRKGWRGVQQRREGAVSSTGTGPLVVDALQRLAQQSFGIRHMITLGVTLPKSAGTRTCMAARGDVFSIAPCSQMAV